MSCLLSRLLLDPGIGGGDVVLPSLGVGGRRVLSTAFGLVFGDKGGSLGFTFLNVR